MTPNRRRKRRGAISANSTSAVPRSLRTSARRDLRGRESRSGAGAITELPLRAPSATRTSFLLVLQVVVDLVEDRRDVGAQQAQDADSGDRDEGQDERVLHHRLTALLVAQGLEREVHPDRDQLRPLHVVPPFGLPRACIRRRTGESRSIPATQFVAHTMDRRLSRALLPLEGWVLTGLWSRLEVGVDVTEDRGRKVADRAQQGECGRRDEYENECVFDNRLPLLVKTQGGRRPHEPVNHQCALLFKAFRLQIIPGRVGAKRREGWLFQSVRLFRSATLRRIGGSEQAVGRLRRPRRLASMRLVARLQAFGDRLRGFAQPWELAAFVWVPGIGIGYACWYELRAHDALQDFGIFRTAALSVVHGRSPYVVPNAAAFAHFDKFVYPPVAALFFAPFAAL